MAIPPNKAPFDFCRRKDEFYKPSGEPVVYDATTALLALPDMFPCDKDGNFLLESRIQMGAGGLRSPQATFDVQVQRMAQNLATTLGVSEEEAMAMMRGQIGGTPDNPDAILEPGSASTGEGGMKPIGGGEEEQMPAPRMWNGQYVSRLNKEDLVDYAKETFGEKAAHLDAETMARKVLVDEVEKMQAEADLAAKRAG